MRTDASKWRTPFAGVALGIVLVAQILASSVTSEAAPRAAPSATVWLCRPGLAADPCDVDEATSAVSASGAVSAVSRTPGRAGFDCFYVYPTVSTELSANADLTVGLTEIDTAKIQASQFSSVCNVYAPMYRQRTLASLATGLGTDPAANAVAYSSLESGWTDFLKDYSNGRPFVLIGHSQGAAMLILLIRNEIDKDPSLRSRLVSAIILGGNVQVPDGKTVGGSFQNVPACTSTSTTGCVIAYSSFPAQPPANADFGRAGQGVSAQSGQTAKNGVHVLCTNPAALSGGSGALEPIFGTRTQILRGVTVETPWVEYPGHYRAACQSGGGATWLQVTDTSGSGDARPTVTESDGPAWGYHADDVNLALGNLLTDVASEEAAYQLKHR